MKARALQTAVVHVNVKLQCRRRIQEITVLQSQNANSVDGFGSCMDCSCASSRR